MENKWKKEKKKVKEMKEITKQRKTGGAEEKDGIKWSAT